MKAEISEPKLSDSALQFIDSVLALKPSIAVFDCDGTLWSGDAGADFFYWEVKHDLIPAKTAEWAQARYRDYKAGLVDEETMCGEMVTINAGVPEHLLQQAAEDFFPAVVAHRIFPDMLQLTRRLKAAGCQLWAVSSTNVWAIRAGVKRFGIPEENVLAACVHIENGLATDQLIRVPTDEGKAIALQETLSKTVDACFGNSIHDADMLAISKHPFAVNPNPDLESIAMEKGWKIHRPMEK